MKTTVFVKKSPFSFHNDVIFCNERAKEIEMCKSYKTKAEKKNVWLFLEDIIEEFLNKNPKEISFRKLVCGRWECDDFFFSLSHSEGYLAVAISPKPVGVDIQVIKDVKPIYNIILSEEEKNIGHTNEELLEIFSKKEAFFKTQNEKFFIPFKMNLNEFKGKCIIDKDFVLSICSEDEVEIIK